jgi:SAM-dependent methyltransferase
MSFDVAASAYGRFMGRYSEPLAGRFADRVGGHAGQSAVDVGCGPGALTAVLANRLGAPHVSAIDPSASFVEALTARLPGVAVQTGTAERLPYADEAFDLALAQLVVHFMQDPVAGLAEMARVTRPGGVVAANVWDYAGGAGPLSLFWRAARDLDPGVTDESGLAGVRQGHLEELFIQAGMPDPTGSTLTVEVSFDSVADWWEPYTLGVGPAGEYVKRLDDTAREALRARCEQLLPEPPFTLTSAAWCVIAHV